MCTYRRLLVPLLALALLMFAGSLAYANPPQQPTSDGGTLVVPPGDTVTGQSSGAGGDGEDGDPDDIIDGLRAVPTINGVSAAPTGQEAVGGGRTLLQLAIDCLLQARLLVR